GAWGLAFLAMLSHEAGLVLALLIPVFDAAAPSFRRPRNPADMLSRYAGYWIAAGAALALRIHAHPGAMDFGVSPEGRPIMLSLSIARAVFLDVVTALAPALATVLGPAVHGAAGGIDLLTSPGDPLATAAVVGLLVALAASL